MPSGTYRSGGIGRYIHEDILDQEWDSNLNFNFNIKEKFNLPIQLVVGHNLNSRALSRFETTGEDQVLPYYYQIENYSSVTADQYLSLVHLESYFVQGTMDLFDQLYLTSALEMMVLQLLDQQTEDIIFLNLAPRGSFQSCINRRYSALVS